MSRHIFVATPTAGQVVRNAYVGTVVALTRLCRDRGWDYDVITHDSADVTLARNYLANTALRQDGVTDLLFIDSDMRIAPMALERMMDADKPMIGGACPQRKIDLEAYAEARGRGHAPEAARGLAMEYNLRLRHGALSIKSGMAEVEAVGFGIAAIRMDLLREMADSGAAPTVHAGLLTQMGMGDEIVDFFSPLPLSDGSYLSEDYSFCRRAGKLGPGRVWAYMGQGIGHAGGMVYEASYVARLRAEQVDRET